MSSYCLKITKDGETRKVVLPSENTYDALASQARRLFKVSPDARVALTYLDEDGDRITLDTQQELMVLLPSLNNLSLSFFLSFFLSWKPSKFILPPATHTHTPHTHTSSLSLHFNAKVGSKGNPDHQF